MVLRLFFSWQVESDTPKQHNKPFIWDCLNAAANNVQNKGDLKGISIEVQEGVRDAPGTPETVNKCFERIDACHIFVSDLTIADRYNWLEKAASRLTGRKHRLEPNSNVLTEYSRARARKEEEQIITVMNTINGSVKEKNELFPIDIRKDRFPITFSLKKDEQFCRRSKYEAIKNRFIKELEVAIVASAKEALKHIDDEMRPFVNWETQKRIGDFRGGYADTPDLQELKKEISESKGNIRVLGMSGLGKTRLVLEAFKDNKDVYWYYDCQYEKPGLLKELLPRIFKDYGNYVLVFDNCDKVTSEEIAGLKRSCQGINPIITIYNGLEEQSDSYVPLSMQDRYDAVVEEIIKRYTELYEEKDRERILDFAGGIPMMAQLLMDGLRNDRALGNVTDESLMSKLILAGVGTNDRRLMQTISLFDFIGYKDDLRREIRFVVTNKDITNIDKADDVLLNDVDELIAKNLKRRIIELRGRKVGIRPAPIAFYLIGEWLSACSDERMLRVVKALQEADCAVALTNAFAEQFRNMGFNEKARQMLNQLMGPKSPFSSAEVINTRLGSRLFRSFAEVNPVAVSNTLWKALGTLDIEQLRLMEEGRRNIVWTLEKLCFEPESFVPAAKTMMRLAQAENEQIANNATQEFIRLFPVLLPATAVDLETRLSFLKDEFAVDANKPMVLRAIKAALHTRDFVYMGGAEKQGVRTLKNYRPQSKSELLDYLQGCADLFMSVASLDSGFWDTCVDIVESDFNSLCIFGASQVILPCFDRIAELKRNDWDSMLIDLHLLKWQKVNPLSPHLAEEIDRRIEILTKQDFVSRFHYVSLRHRWDYSEGWEARLREDAQKYRALADELVSDKLFSTDLLSRLFSLDVFGVEPFGSRIADSIPNEERMAFYENAVQSLSPEKNLGYSIINSFLQRVDEDFYSQAHSLLLSKAKYRLLFSSVASRSYPLEHIFVEQLFNLVENGQVSVELFQQYWANIQLDRLTDQDLSYLFGRLSRIDGGVLLSFWMAERLTYSITLSNYPETVTVLEALVLSTETSDYSEMKSDSYWQVVSILLKNENRNDLAIFIIKRILSYMGSQEELYMGNYHIEDALSILLEQYFDIIWPTLANALSNTNPLQSFNLQHTLGERVSNIISTPGLLFRQDHTETLLNWCEEDPRKNAAVLMAMAPVCEQGEDAFSPIVRELINRYGDIPGVLDSLSTNMGTFSYVGSPVPLFESYIRLLATLNTHPKEQVRMWASRMIAGYEVSMDYEKKYEEEQDFRIRESSL